MGTRAQFEARDLSPCAISIDRSADKKYLGVERRNANRRCGLERRTDVRFEPGKEDRRQNNGRRDDDGTATFW